MKDKHDTAAMELDATLITPKMVERCPNIAGQTMQEYPFMRLGKSYMNALWDEYQASGVWSELFYEKDVDKDYVMIIK